MKRLTELGKSWPVNGCLSITLAIDRWRFLRFARAIFRITYIEAGERSNILHEILPPIPNHACNLPAHHDFSRTCWSHVVPKFASPCCENCCTPVTRYP